MASSTEKSKRLKAFNRAAEKPEASSTNFVEAILDERPDLNGQPVYVPSQGQFGYTVFIGDEVFKGPNSPITAQVFDAEPAILQELAGKGLPVPEVTTTGRKTIFYGMTRLPGIPLESVERKLSTEALKSLAAEVADFMIGMALALPRRNGLLATQGDLREANILIDPDTKKLAGIIDFGLAHDVTKNDLMPEWTEYAPFKRMVREALDKRKGELPDTPKGVVSKASPILPSRETWINRPV